MAKSALTVMTAAAIFLVLGVCAKAALRSSKPPAAKLAAEIRAGNVYYHGAQYRCYQCHGMKGEGGRGPKLQGIAKKIGWEALMRKATHMCPPTGACPPGVLQSIGRYLQTL